MTVLDRIDKALDIVFEEDWRDGSIMIRVPRRLFDAGHPGEILAALRHKYRAEVLDRMAQRRHIRLKLLRAKRDRLVRIGRMEVVRRIRKGGA